METTHRHKAKDKNKGFWNWKRTLLVSVTFVITIGLVAWTVTSISKPTFNWTEIGTSINNNSGLWSGMLILLISWFIFNFLYRAYPIVHRLKRIGIKVSFKEQVIFVFSITFMNAITPGAFVTEPYAVFWLKTKGVSTAKASAIVWVNDFMWHIISVAIVIPSFAVLCTNHSLMTFLTTKGGGISMFTLICIGFAIDMFMFALYIFMGFSRHFHYWLSRSFNTVKKWFHMQHHTKGQTIKTYLLDATLQREAKMLLKDWKTTILTLLINGVFQIVIYTSLFAALSFVNTGIASAGNFAHIFNVANVVSVANKYLPIPGGEGLTQWQMKYMLQYIETNPVVSDENVNNGIFVWRAFTTYIPALIGISGFIAFVVSCIHKAKHNKKIIKKAKSLV